MESNDPISVWPIVHRQQPQKYGTGFVVHTEAAEKVGNCAAFLVTCAHVDNDIGEQELTVGGRPAKLLKKGKGDDPDLAVITVVLPAHKVQTLQVDPAIDEDLSGIVYGYGCTKTSHDLTPLTTRVTKSITPVPFGQMPGSPKLQVTVQLNVQIEPDQIEKGYSGSPFVVAGRVRAVVDTRRSLGERKPYKVGTVIPISRLTEIWPRMPDALRTRLRWAAEVPEPIRNLLQLDAQVPSVVARKVFDAAGCELPSWPSCTGAGTFADCVRVLGELDRVELEEWRYHPLAEYVRRVAAQLKDPDAAERLSEIVRTVDAEPSFFPDTGEPDRAAERQQALVIRIIPDVEAIEESTTSGQRLRLLPYLLEQQIEPCGEPCDGTKCRSVPTPANVEFTFLGCLALETSTAQLSEDLQGKMSQLFNKCCGGVPNRVEFFVPRIFASAALTAAVDRLPVRLDNGDEGNLNAWATAFYHVDERLNHEDERKQLAARLAPRTGAIKLGACAETLDQLRNDPKTAYDAVFVGREPATAVVHCLQHSVSLVCAMFRTPDSARRNLSHVLRFPLPFVLVSRSPESVDTLNELVEATYCLRQFPHALNERIAFGDSHASEIAAIVDLPEYRCDFDRAQQEPILNENL